MVVVSFAFADFAFSQNFANRCNRRCPLYAEAALRLKRSLDQELSYPVGSRGLCANGRASDASARASARRGAGAANEL